MCYQTSACLEVRDFATSKYTTLNKPAFLLKLYIYILIYTYLCSYIYICVHIVNMCKLVRHHSNN